jgi:DNA-binding MarR family transcriptional regulator
MRAKLTPAQVRRIWKLSASGCHSQGKLAKMFNVSQSAISMLLRRLTYRNVAA